MYAWILAFHTIAFVAWFAGLLYLPRLFIDHLEALRKHEATGASRFQGMERKLYRVIMTPAMIVTLFFGIWLLLLDFQNYLTDGWFYTKLALVIVLIGFHHICLSQIKRFETATQKRGSAYFRIFALVPVLLLIAIVILSVVKPY